MKVEDPFKRHNSILQKKKKSTVKKTNSCNSDTQELFVTHFIIEQTLLPSITIQNARGLVRIAKMYYSLHNIGLILKTFILDTCQNGLFLK